MAADAGTRGMWVVVASFIISMMLMIVSMPRFVPVELGYLRPEWVAMVLIYWVIALPDRIGVMTAWVLGLFTDVLLGSLLGQHALAFIVIAFIASRLYQRMRMFSVWQQSLIVFALIGLNQLINFWIESIAGLAEWSMWYLFPSVVSAMLWPWVFLILRYMRRSFDVS